MTDKRVPREQCKHLSQQWTIGWNDTGAKGSCVECGEDLTHMHPLPMPAATAERDALKTALRNEYIRSPSSGRMGCLRCDSSWTHPGPERHKPGCLAAPGTMNDDLLGRLREAASAIALCLQMETRHGETCDLAYERIDALKAALRKVALRSNDRGNWCECCDGSWLGLSPERHAPGCLAAPEDAP